MAELFIYDDIGPDWLGMVSAKSIMAELDKTAGPVTVRINSPGGDVNEAMAIYNALSRRADVTVEIDGIAASAASYIAMAGKTIRIAENAMIMIHNPWTFAMGDANELRKTAGVLDKYGQGIVDVYAARSGKPAKDVAAKMDAETWFSAQEAIDYGLANEIGQPLKVAASIAPGRFKNCPQQAINPAAPAVSAQRRQQAAIRAAIHGKK